MPQLKLLSRRKSVQPIVVVAVISYKYDADHLVDLQANIAGIADKCIIQFDTHGDLLRDEGRYREAMVRQAEAAGADYILSIDPDERLEKRAARRIRKLLRKHLGERVLFEFHVRELYTPTKYRVDGVWGRKSRFLIFPAFADNEYSSGRLHSPHQPINAGYRSIHTGLNLYHLKHISAELRRNRRDTYTALDPQARFNPAGYDYLDDESGMVLRSIAGGRAYSPKYRQYQIDPGIFEIQDLGQLGEARGQSSMAAEGSETGELRV